MNDLIQSLPSPSPTTGISHTWMGESWMVDGETSVMMVMKISSKSPSRQGSRTEFLVPNYGFWCRRRSGSLSGKNAEPPLLSCQRVYVGRRRGRGDGRGGLTTGGHGQAWAAPPGCVAASQPLSVHLLALWVFWWNRIFAIFSWIFTESWISAQKQDTIAILLKIALVRVSCIQNTQIRGETTAKVFGKVDTFWTYQLPPSLAYCLSSSNSVNNWVR
jgi:hypothetical protein